MKIQEIFLNYIEILSVDRARKHLPEMDSKVHRRHKKIFKRVRAQLVPSTRFREKWRASPAVDHSLRDKVIELVNEELDRAPPVHSSRRIRHKTVRAIKYEK